jgi:hypothetical protein
VKVQDRWDPKQARHAEQNKFAERASAERHMDVRDVDPMACASEGEGQQAGQKMKWHLPKRTWPVRVHRSDFDIAGPEGSEKVTSHPTHAAAALQAARRDVDDPNGIGDNSHDRTVQLALKSSVTIIISHRLCRRASRRAHILTRSNRTRSKRIMVAERSGYHFVGKRSFATTGISHGG